MMEMRKRMWASRVGVRADQAAHVAQQQDGDDRLQMQAGLGDVATAKWRCRDQGWLQAASSQASFSVKDLHVSLWQQYIQDGGAGAAGRRSCGTQWRRSVPGNELSKRAKGARAAGRALTGAGEEGGVGDLGVRGAGRASVSSC
jgi:hypothetical protein